MINKLYVELCKFDDERKNIININIGINDLEILIENDIKHDFALISITGALFSVLIFILGFVAIKFNHIKNDFSESHESFDNEISEQSII